MTKNLGVAERPSLIGTSNALPLAESARAGKGVALAIEREGKVSLIFRPLLEKHAVFVLLMSTIAFQGCISPVLIVGGWMTLGGVMSGIEYAGDQPYINRVQDFPPGHDHEQVPPIILEFALPQPEAEEAWNRAKEWIRIYSIPTLVRATDTVLETDSPPPVSVKEYGIFWSGPPPPTFGYAITRMAHGDGKSAQFTLKCWFGDTAHLKDYMARIVSGAYQSVADSNAHILAWYVTTGELRAKLIKGRRE